jgi:hypothetical protein
MILRCVAAWRVRCHWRHVTDCGGAVEDSLSELDKMQKDAVEETVVWKGIGPGPS